MNEGDWKAMFKAVQSGDIALTEYYLKAGIDPNYQHPEFLSSVLVESIRCDQIEIAKLLIENGANPKVKEAFGGDTPMSIASANQNKRAMDMLKRFIDKHQ